MEWFYTTLLAILFLAAGDITQQRGLSDSNLTGEKLATSITIWIQALIALIAVGILGIDYSNLLNSIYSKHAVNILIVAFLAAFGTYLYFKSFKVQNISFSIIFVSLSVVVSTNAGHCFFRRIADFSQNYRQLINFGRSRHCKLQKYIIRSKITSMV